MDIGHFYFLQDQYFKDFDDSYLMTNKETVKGSVHDRPCFYAFKDPTNGLYWMIPISSQVSKFSKIYQNKVAKYGHCDTIQFGDVLGRRKAFLIQNMCPISEKYIKNEYKDAASGLAVQLNGAFEKELLQKAKKVLALQRRGVKLIFPDVLKIEKVLLSQEDSATL